MENKSSNGWKFFALLFGVLISTYSTVFTATPIAYDLIRRKEPAAK